MEVHEDVAVLGATEDGSHVVVDLYGSPANLCGTARFVIADPAGRRAAVDTLARWERDATPLMLVAGQGRVSLQDPSAMFAAQLLPRRP